MTTVWSDAIFSVLTPRPRLTVSQWADQYRVVPAGTSPEPDRWRTSRVPYLREIMDAVSDPAVERVVVMAGSQLGKSEFLLNVIGYYADADPSPILLVQPTEDASRSFAKERVEKMFRATPVLRGKLADSLRDKENTILLKLFPGGMLACAWATSSVALASRPIRVVLLDEVDRYPSSVGNDGNPVEQAIQRTANFRNRKIIAVSTPTVDGLSEIVRMHDETDQRRLWLPCPRCGAFQVLEWSGLIFRDAAKRPTLDDIYYLCQHCKGRIEERERPEMLAACRWEPTHPGRPRRGYHLSALYSPWVRWRELAEQWIKVHEERDRRGQQEFLNLRLGEPWVEGGDEIHPDALDGNREPYEAEVPDGVLLLVAGVDVQSNRFEVEIVGWGVGKESWGIAYQVVSGDTSIPETWGRLDALLARSWAREDGSALGLWCTCVDSGHRTSDVYEFCRARLARNVFAVKGRSGAGLPIAGKPSMSNQLRIPLYPVGVDTAKDALSSRLALRDVGPGYCHFPNVTSTGYDAEYFKGLCSEKRKVKFRGGRRIQEWVQVRARNEPLDCRVYATAAMELLVPDFAALAATRAAQQQSPSRTPTPPKSGRRVLSRGVR